MPVTLSETETYTSAVTAPNAGDPRTAASVRAMGTPIANRTLWLWKRLQALIGTFAPISSNAPVAATVDATTDYVSCAGHGLLDGDRVRFVAVGAGVLPTGIVSTTVYYVDTAGTDEFQITATSGGSAVNITDNGTAPFYAIKVSQPEIYMPPFAVSSHTLTAGRLSAILAQLGSLGGSNVWSALNTFTSLALATSALLSLGTITDASSADIDIQKPAWIATSVSQQINVQVLDLNAANGHLLFVSRDPAGAFSVVIKREGSAAAIVTLGSATATGAVLIRRGGLWRLLFAGTGATAGAEA